VPITCTLCTFTGYLLCVLHLLSFWLHVFSNGEGRLFYNNTQVIHFWQWNKIQWRFTCWLWVPTYLCHRIVKNQRFSITIRIHYRQGSVSDERVGILLITSLTGTKNLYRSNPITKDCRSLRSRERFLIVRLTSLFCFHLLLLHIFPQYSFCYFLKWQLFEDKSEEMVSICLSTT
jgi:hypothetical protein